MGRVVPLELRCSTSASGGCILPAEFNQRSMDVLPTGEWFYWSMGVLPTEVPDTEGFYWGMDSDRVMLLNHIPGALEVHRTPPWGGTLVK